MLGLLCSALVIRLCSLAGEHVQALGNARDVFDGFGMNLFFIPEVHVERQRGKLF